MPARGVALFAGTKVPVQALLDWLKEGETVSEFLRYFPAVTREQALQALAAAGLASKHHDAVSAPVSAPASPAAG
jgi:uncharacterized protein (DUF433 family)